MAWAESDSTSKKKADQEPFNPEQFLQRLEIQLSKQRQLLDIGQKKADSPDFQEYHQAGSDRLSQLKNKLQDLMTKMEVSPMAKDDAEDAVTLKDLRQASDADFEKLYVQALGKNLSSIIVNCQQALNETDDARIQEIANVVMYKAKMELDEVNDLHESALEEQEEAEGSKKE